MNLKAITGAFDIFGVQKRYLQKYKKAVERLNDVLGRNEYDAHEYVCVGIDLMKREEVTGFTPKAMIDITEKVAYIIAEAHEPDSDIPKFVADAIFKSYARASQAKEKLEEICESRPQAPRWDFFQNVREQLDGWSYKPKRPSSRNAARA